MADASILTGTKKMLGLTEDDTSFDLDVMTFINAVFVTLNELGIGPTDGFMIEDETAVWSDFLGSDKRLNNVRTYTYLRVRILFDPPGTSYLLDSLTKQIQELEWRMNVYRENTSWVDPDPASELGSDDEPLILDGGVP